MTKTQSKHFFRIDKPAAGRPLIVELPALANQLSTFGESTVAAEQDNDDVTRKNRHALSLFHHVRFPTRRENQTFAGARSSASFYTVDALRAEKLIRVASHVALLYTSGTK